MALINIPGELMRLIFGSTLKETCDLEQITWFDWFLGFLLVFASIYLLLMPIMDYYFKRRSSKK